MIVRFGALGVLVLLAAGALRAQEGPGEGEPDRGSVPAPETPEPEPPTELPREEEIAGAGAEESDVADPERYQKGPGW